ncbi:uncharacterized protein SCDLUD_002134 [Saccharomycodes ludwigii]|uniref:uncharacterized protein n=1 Tax=Saccharomycodes ludwigii TaxID=36035 RepID=UPI001E87D104|nr:hypothetical protein SCDLUD_002134 [Saccharomycodes ludwigii]KAH3902314.1 hypothetical protein SCDLUD_002134 [Saccharomycodes ludwigii]
MEANSIYLIFIVVFSILPIYTLQESNGGMQCITNVIYLLIPWLCGEYLHIVAPKPFQTIWWYSYAIQNFEIIQIFFKSVLRKNFNNKNVDQLTHTLIIFSRFIVQSSLAGSIGYLAVWNDKNQLKKEQDSDKFGYSKKSTNIKTRGTFMKYFLLFLGIFSMNSAFYYIIYRLFAQMGY